ncbi:uncharacterized protein K441DRAFT_662569 [Cenococcum geophilum 1.58]|uniref:uncharacterized protein n=1 Tax=Cenococcum geophilum 1.58 TaxID=794803 RepID=UPI00358FFCD2|nr:hypothetical protein K441DRAFT_662569 [Cenococcum geophilum 1.58]
MDHFLCCTLPTTLSTASNTSSVHIYAPTSRVQLCPSHSNPTPPHYVFISNTFYTYDALKIPRYHARSAYPVSYPPLNHLNVRGNLAPSWSNATPGLNRVFSQPHCLKKA